MATVRHEFNCDAWANRVSMTMVRHEFNCDAAAGFKVLVAHESFEVPSSLWLRFLLAQSLTRSAAA